MPNIAAVLKDEIRRLAKREIKTSTSSTKQAVAQYRRDIAKLKRQVQAQHKEVAFLKAQERKRLGQPQVQDEEELEGVRFRPDRSAPSGNGWGSASTIMASWWAFRP